MDNRIACTQPGPKGRENLSPDAHQPLEWNWTQRHNRIHRWTEKVKAQLSNSRKPTLPRPYGWVLRPAPQTHNLGPGATSPATHIVWIKASDKQASA